MEFPHEDQGTIFSVSLSLYQSKKKKKKNRESLLYVSMDCSPWTNSMSAPSVFEKYLDNWLIDVFRSTFWIIGSSIHIANKNVKSEMENAFQNQYVWIPLNLKGSRGTLKNHHLLYFKLRCIPSPTPDSNSNSCNLWAYTKIRFSCSGSKITTDDDFSFNPSGVAWVRKMLETTRRNIIKAPESLTINWKTHKWKWRWENASLKI